MRRPHFGCRNCHALSPFFTLKPKWNLRRVCDKVGPQINIRRSPRPLNLAAPQIPLRILLHIRALIIPNRGQLLLGPLSASGLIFDFVLSKSEVGLQFGDPTAQTFQQC